MYPFLLLCFTYGSESCALTEHSVSSQTDSDNFEVDSVYLIIFFKKQEVTVRAPSELVVRYLTGITWFIIFQILWLRQNHQDETVTWTLRTFVSPKKCVSSVSHQLTEIITESSGYFYFFIYLFIYFQHCYLLFYTTYY